MKNDVVAIDGPSASGKSTVARNLAKALNYLFVDSGSLYRGATWQALQRGVDTGDMAAVAGLVPETHFEFFVKDGAVCFRLNGVELDREIRTEEINRNVSKVASVPQMRVKIVAALRSLIELGNLVIEGRDISTVVFPAAKHKYYIDASPEERARRRYREMAGSESFSQDEVLDSIRKRDNIDSTRSVDPLRAASDAERVDTTDMNIGQVVELLRDRILGS